MQDVRCMYILLIYDSNIYHHNSNHGIIIILIITLSYITLHNIPIHVLVLWTSCHLLPFKGAPLVESNLCGKPLPYTANLENK